MSGITTSILYRDSIGWWSMVETAVTGIYGIKEAYLSLAPLEHEQALIAVEYQFGIFASAREEITADIEPIGASAADRPFVDYGLGDRITMPAMHGGTVSEVVRSMAVTVDANGKARFALGVADLLQTVQERHERAISKAHDGSFVGQAPPAIQPIRRPVESAGKSTPAKAIEFSGYEADIIAQPVSGIGSPEKLATLKRARLLIDTAAASDLHVELRYNGSAVTNSPIVITAGNTEGEIDGNALAVTPDQRYEVELLTTGVTGWGKATVILEHA